MASAGTNNNQKKENKKVADRRTADQEKFLKVLEDMPVIQVAAARTGIHRCTYYRWYEEDRVFKERADKALASGNHFINDMTESMLIKQIKEDKIAAIIFRLKTYHPNYMEIKRFEYIHKHEFKENVLTKERKKEISESMQKWDEVDPDEDERDEDYESTTEEEKVAIEAKRVQDDEKEVVTEVKPIRDGRKSIKKLGTCFPRPNIRDSDGNPIK